MTQQETTTSISVTCVPHTNPRAPQGLNGACVILIRGKSIADRAPASVTDEDLVHDSTGSGGPGD